MKSNRLAMLALLISIAAMIAAIMLPRSTEKQAPVIESSFLTIRTKGTIIAGWAPYPPFSSVNASTKNPEGYYIDLFNKIAEEAGFKVEWVETTWGTMVSDLHANRFQVMAAPVFRTIPRAKEVWFSNTISYFGLSAVVRKDESRFKQLSDFNNQAVTIAVTQGEVGHDFATRHLPNAKLTVHKTGNISLALVDVIQGRADAGICDSWTARQFAREHQTEVRDLFGGKPFNRVGAGWFVRPGDIGLMMFLNTSIDWLHSTAYVEDAAKKYGLDLSVEGVQK